MKVVVEEFPEGKVFRILKNIKYKKQKYFYFPLLSLVLLPAVILFINTTAFTFTKQIVIQKNLNLSKTYFYLILKTNRATEGTLRIYAKTPVIKSIYEQLYLFSQTLGISTEIGIEKINASLLMNNVVENSLKNINYNPKEEAGKIDLIIENILEKEGFLKAERGYLEKHLLTRQIVKGGFLDTYPETDLLIKYKSIAEKFGDLFGDNEERNYALIFQNKNTIRASGGLILSSFVLTFSKGRLENILFYSPSEIDKRLTGEVEAPYPLNRSSGKWTFENVGWASDTSSYAKDVQWYLEKSLGIKTDGVIFVNENITDKQAFEAKTNIFLELNPFRKLEVLNNIVKSTDKDILIYMNKTDELNIFAGIGLANQLPKIQCTGCTQDFLSIVESDLSASGYNTTIIREAELKISIQDKIIKKKLNLLLRRLGDDENQHEIYLRFVVPVGFSFSPVEINNEKYLGRIETINDYRQLGIIVSIGKTEKEKIINLNFEGMLVSDATLNNYIFNWISQPGVLNFYSKLIFEEDKKNGSQVTSNESLTRTNGGVYNTNLVPFKKDIKLNLYY